MSIPTFGVGKTQAILNIKNVLNQGKAVWFAFFMPTSSDWSTFGSFWSGQSESAVWDPTYSCGKTWASGGGGHAVLCVGYDDTDPNNRYWIMLNSWGAPSLRPNGLFRMSMEMNYDGVYYYGSTALLREHSASQLLLADGEYGGGCSDCACGYQLQWAKRYIMVLSQVEW